MLNSQQALDQHTRDKHPSFECQYCGREFATEHGCGAHEEAKHSVFKCKYCYLTFRSRATRQQHEDTKHHFECDFCGTSFTEVQALRQHERTTPHFECSYCTDKLFTPALKRAHEVSCGCNPANKRPIVPPWRTGLLQIGSSSSSDPKLTENVEEELSTSEDEGSESPASPSRSSHSTLDEGEIFHSTSALSSIDAKGEGPIVTQPCACTCSLGSGMCLICQQTPSLSSNTDKLAADEAESIVSAYENPQDGSKDYRVAIFQCTPCFKFFETEESFRDHACSLRTAMLRPHCPVCYTQFDDGPSLQNHLEGLESVSCQLCLARCCSDEMLQDHLLDHPTCGRCGKSFASDLALCAVRIIPLSRLFY